MANFQRDYDIPGVNPQRLGRLALLAGGGFLLFVVAMMSFTTVAAGERGVVFSRIGGVQDRILTEGWQFKVPFVENIIHMDVKIQKSETPASASSRDLQVVRSVIALNYHLDPTSVNRIYQDVGLSYETRIIDPAVQESVKAITAQFTAEELITKREQVSAEIKSMLTGRLSRNHILVDEFSITELDFSEVFNNSIEAKQVAEQQALKARQDLERIKIEAEQKLAAATAEAEAQRLQRETITAELIQLRAIEKWDGRLPQVAGGATPFIDVKSLGQ